MWWTWGLWLKVSSLRVTGQESSLTSQRLINYFIITLGKQPNTNFKVYFDRICTEPMILEYQCVCVWVFYSVFLCFGHWWIIILIDWCVMSSDWLKSQLYIKFNQQTKKKCFLKFKRCFWMELILSHDQ